MATTAVLPCHACQNAGDARILWQLGFVIMSHGLPVRVGKHVGTFIDFPIVQLTPWGLCSVTLTSQTLVDVLQKLVGSNYTDK